MVEAGLPVVVVPASSLVDELEVVVVEGDWEEVDCVVFSDCDELIGAGVVDVDCVVVE